MHIGYGCGMISREEILVLRKENCKVRNVKFLWYFSTDRITVMKCVIHLERHCHPVSVCSDCAGSINAVKECQHIFV